MIPKSIQVYRDSLTVYTLYDPKTKCGCALGQILASCGVPKEALARAINVSDIEALTSLTWDEVGVIAVLNDGRVPENKIAFCWKMNKPEGWPKLEYVDGKRPEWQ